MEANQPLPRMGTALRAYLSRYKNDFGNSGDDRIISEIVACCDFLLIESERLEREEEHDQS